MVRSDWRNTFAEVGPRAKVRHRLCTDCGRKHGSNSKRCAPCAHIAKQRKDLAATLAAKERARMREASILAEALGLDFEDRKGDLIAALDALAAHRLVRRGLVVPVNPHYREQK